MLLGTDLAAQDVRDKAVQYLIQHKQFGDSSIQVNNADRRFYFKLIKQVGLRRSPKVYLYTFGSLSSHAMDFAMIKQGENIIFLGSQHIEVEIFRLMTFFSKESEKEKLHILKAVLPSVIDIYKLNIRSEDDNS